MRKKKKKKYKTDETAHETLTLAAPPRQAMRTERSIVTRGTNRESEGGQSVRLSSAGAASLGNEAPLIAATLLAEPIIIMHKTESHFQDFAKKEENKRKLRC